ncbi:unnamed protein product [Linum trigynum]|uniref:Uncharacterized protein n=1 Tax=Linum trigynum TaxID=586398 RepID=A0AAV2E6X4_9ROSI
MVVAATRRGGKLVLLHYRRGCRDGGQIKWFNSLVHVATFHLWQVTYKRQMQLSDSSPCELLWEHEIGLSFLPFLPLIRNFPSLPNNPTRDSYFAQNSQLISCNQALSELPRMGDRIVGLEINSRRKSVSSATGCSFGVHAMETEANRGDGRTLDVVAPPSTNCSD